MILAVSRTFDDQKRAQARELASRGLGCNAIAREIGVAASTISAWAKSAGVVFDRSQTELAVRAHTIDMAEARALLAQSMLIEAQQELESLDGPYLVHSFGGRDNKYREKLLDSAPMEARSRAMTNAGIAFDKATRILERSNPDLDAAEGLLDMSAAMFEAAADRVRARRTEAAVDAPADT